jgi:hypothetical protein
MANVFSHWLACLTFFQQLRCASIYAAEHWPWAIGQGSSVAPGSTHWPLWPRCASSGSFPSNNSERHSLADGLAPARLTQTDRMQRTQPHLTPLACHGEDKYRALQSGPGNLQLQATAVVVIINGLAGLAGLACFANSQHR